MDNDRDDHQQHVEDSSTANARVSVRRRTTNVVPYYPTVHVGRRPTTTTPTSLSDGYYHHHRFNTEEGGQTTTTAVGVGTSRRRSSSTGRFGGGDHHYYHQQQPQQQQMYDPDCSSTLPSQEDLDDMMTTSPIPAMIRSYRSGGYGIGLNIDMDIDFDLDVDWVVDENYRDQHRSYDGSISGGSLGNTTGSVRQRHNRGSKRYSRRVSRSNRSVDTGFSTDDEDDDDSKLVAAVDLLWNNNEKTLSDSNTVLGNSTTTTTTLSGGDRSPVPSSPMNRVTTATTATTRMSRRRSSRRSFSSTSQTSQSQTNNNESLVHSNNNTYQHAWKFIPAENSTNTRMSRAKSMIAKDKLSFTKLKIYGRQHEIRQLLGCLDRLTTGKDMIHHPKQQQQPPQQQVTADVDTTSVTTGILHSSSSNNNNDDVVVNSTTTTGHQSQIVIISGKKGVGKSTLATLIAHKMSHRSGLFLYGRFDSNDLYEDDCHSSSTSMEGSQKTDVHHQHHHEQQQQPPPFSAISSAFRRVCGALLHLSRRDRPKWSRIRSRLIHSVGPITSIPSSTSSFTPGVSSSSFSVSEGPYSDEWNFLFHVMPELEEVMSIDVAPLPGTSIKEQTESTTMMMTTMMTRADANCITDNGKKSTMGDVPSRFSQVFHDFLLALIHDEGLRRFCVICLDDLQYADTDSLDLIYALSTYDDIRLLLIMTVSSEEYDDGTYSQIESTVDKIRKTIRSDPESEESSKATEPVSRTRSSLVELDIKNFTEEDVQEMLMILLNYDLTSSLKDLARICHKRTAGNIHQLKRFLRHLQTNELITFNVLKWSWEWDLNRIVSETSAAENVVDDLYHKLLGLPAAIQTRLCLATYLGSTFDASIESIVWSSLTGTGKKNTELKPTTDDWLEVVVDCGVLEGTSNSTDKVMYRWTHENLFDSSIDLLPEDERAAYRPQITTVLLDSFSQTQNADNMYLISDLVAASRNDGSFVPTASVNIARLCCLAAKMASEKVSFQSMHRFAITGIDYLPQQAWDEHFRLTLDLYSYGAQSAAALGLEEEMYHLFHALNDQSGVSAIDKAPIYKAIVQNRSVYTDIEHNQEAVRFASDSLAEFGITFPSRTIRRTVASVRLLLKLRRQIRALEPKDVVDLPRTVDPARLCIMDIMRSALGAVFVNAEKDLSGLWILTFVNYALESGVSKFLPLAFSQLGVVFSSINDRPNATKCGKIVDVLNSAFPNDFEETCSETIAFSGAFVFAYCKPYHTVRRSLLDIGYAKGLSLGQKNSVDTCLVFYAFMSFFASCPLRSVEADCKKYIEQIRDLNFSLGTLEQAGNNIAMLHQCSLNLLGRSDDPMVLCGDAIPNLTVFEEVVTMESGKCFMLMLQEYLCMIFSEYEQGADLALANEGRFQKSAAGMFLNMPETFARGVNLFGAARRTKKMKYRRAAKRVLNVTRKWARENNPNVQHYLQLFQAEMFALNRKNERAELLYHRAVSLAKRSGFVSDAAVISERCADFYRSRKSYDDAHYKMNEACRMYNEWGCGLKSSILQRKYSSLFDDPQIPSTIVLDGGLL